MKRYGLSVAKSCAKLIVPVSAIVFIGTMGFSLAIILTYRAQSPAAVQHSAVQPAAAQ